MIENTNSQKNLKSKYAARFSELVAEGNSIIESIQIIPPNTRRNVTTFGTRYNWDPQRLARWKTNCLTLLSPLAPNNKFLSERIEVFTKTSGKKPDVKYCLGILEAFQSDYERGFLDNLLLKIEAEVSGDYMGQAEVLLGEGRRSHYDHVPAAVLTGAVLEKALRTLCNLQEPPIVLLKANGDPKTMNPLIDELKAAGVFNELKAKQLRSWADIRNKAAHGEFDQFKRQDVEHMIQGVSNFLGEYLG